MSLGLILLFLHIATMISAVTIAYGPTIVYRLAVRTGRVENVRGVLLGTRPFAPFIPVLFAAGGLFGLATAIDFGFNLLAPWLVIAYALWFIAMLTGAGVSGPYSARVGRLAAAAPDGPIQGDLAAAIADPRIRVVWLVDYVIIFAIIFDMVVKPFS